MRLGPQSILRMWGQPISASLEARALANDTEALIAFTEGMSKSAGLDDVPPQCTNRASFSSERTIRTSAAAKVCSAQMPNATLVTFPGLNHAGTFLQRDLALAAVRQFLGAQVLASHG